MAVVLAVSLGVGLTGEPAPRTLEERAMAVADTVRCPTCRSQSAADSDAPASVAIRTEIEARLRDGQTDGQIRAYLVSRYGEDVLLRPSGSGLTGLVWALPVAAVVVAAAGLAVAFRRWRGGAPPAVTDEDRALVERARAAT
jgi:cytochrome c-type biogenesis protein CcmH